MPQNKINRNAHMNSTGRTKGDPGYRTRGNRFGFDPIDTPAESARMEGMFLRALFTNRLRTRNPFYLGLMFIFGIIPFSILFIVTMEILFNSPSESVVLIILLPPTIITGALGLNFIKNIQEITWGAPSPKKHKPAMKPRKKKQPKRRKDYR